MKEMTPRIAEELRQQLEEVRVALGHVLTHFHDYGQTEWTGGSGGTPRNFKVPTHEIEEAFQGAREALSLLTKADTELCLWEARGAVPFQQGDELGAEWFQARFYKVGEEERRKR